MRRCTLHGSRTLGLLALCLAAGRVCAVDQGELVASREGVLQLRTGDWAPGEADNLLGAVAFERGVHHVIALDGPMTPDRRARLAAIGVNLRGYLPTNAYIASLEGVAPAALANLGFVRWVVRFRDEWKIAPSVAQSRGWVWESDRRRAIAAAGNQCLRVWLFAGADDAPLRELLNATPGASVRSDQTTLGARSLGLIVPLGLEHDLAALAAVQCVEPVPEYTDRSNATTRWVVQSNVQGVTPFYDRGITGVGQVVGVIDSGVAINHCAFLDTVNPIGPLHRKILAYNVSPWYGLHGTHVACTAAGDDGTSGNTRGIAYGSKIVYNTHPDGTEQSMFDHFELHHTQGAFVHTNSWGTDAFRDYDGGARGVDAFTHQYEDDLVLFAVTDIMPLVMNPENAKNCVAVYATSQSPNQGNWCFGGSAPTLDGRRKPEVGAPGCSILSASGSTGCSTSSQSGTSMATPAVAGLATLAREYYTRGFYPSGVENQWDAFVPSGSLLRATLAASGADLTGVAGYPSVREGWGRVLGDAASFFPGDQSRTLLRDVRTSSAGALQTGQESITRMWVDSASTPLKVALAWADFPAVVNASFTPVNNLDLVVTSPSGVEYRGNAFAGGVSQPGGAADAINNLEVVLVAAPELGLWRVRVVGAGVNEGPQGYAWIATGGVADGGCLGDYNRDGNVDQDDVAALIQDVASGDPSFPPNSPDINEDGNVDQDDVWTLIGVVAGSGCD